MAEGQVGQLTGYLRRLLGGRRAAPAGDGPLLERFALRRDGDAFADLVERHGPMVLGVCRRVLGHEHDAEDAFQATFLVLARKAPSVRRASLGAWLHQVAYHLALRARAAAARRRAQERQAPPVPSPDPQAELALRELRPLLDQELSRLPEKYRAPLVLCHLEGKTHEQAARALGWPTGSLSKRLARGRELLRRRLTRRGVALSAAALAAGLEGSAAAALPVTLASATARAALAFTAEGAAGGLLSASVTALAEGALKAMFMTKLKGAALLLALAALGAGVGLLASHGRAGDPRDPERAAAPPGKKVEAPGGAAAAPKPAAGWRWKEKVKVQPAGDEDGHEIFTRLAFTPDGKRLAGGGGMETVRLWDGATGKRLAAFPRDSGEPAAMAFSSDGRRVVTAGQTEVALWEVATRRKLAAFKWRIVEPPPTGADLARGAVPGRSLDDPAPPMPYAAFSPDGRLLAVNSDQGGVQLWDLKGLWARREAPKKPHALLAGKALVDYLAFSPDGKALAAARTDGAVTLWEVPAGKKGKTFKHPAAVVPGDPLSRAVAFSADGRLLATAAGDGLKLWDRATAKELVSLSWGKGKKKEDRVTAVALTPDNRTAAVGRQDGAIHLWDLGDLWARRRAPAKAAAVLPGPADESIARGAAAVDALRFSPDGRRLASASVGAGIKIWEATPPGRAKE